MKCKNCGAEYDGRHLKCPYCGTMNRSAAYKDFRRKVKEIIDKFFGLKAEVYDSVSKMIISSLLRSFLIIIVVLVLAFGASSLMKINYYEDPAYDQRVYENIVWENENLDKLNEAWEKGDLDTIKTLYAQNSSMVQKWEHFSSYYLKQVYKGIMDEDSYFSVYWLEDVLYFVYAPEYYTNMDKLSEEERAIYEDDRISVLALAQRQGYEESYLREIYDKCSDDSYLSVSKLEEYLWEGE